MSLLEAPVSLRDRQIAKLKKMLHMNVDVGQDLVSSSNQEELIWKVLVMDRRSTAIVSSVLRVNDLLEYGVTMHALIDQRRAALPDVSAIYFLEPTAENIAKTIADIDHDQYDDFYVNVTSSMNRSLLEEFAKKVAQTGKSYKIKQVYDQYLDFVVTEPNLFSLDLKNVYTEFNSPSTTEDQIVAKADELVDGLFSAVLTMGSVPVIRCNRGGPAELICQRLDQRLRDHVINTRQASGGASSSVNAVAGASKLVLVVLDRNVDLSSMFAHSWIYQCMVSDVFQLERNTIEIDSTDEKGQPQVKRYDIDPHDFFWNENAALPFPDAVQNVETELNKYTEEAQEITKKTGYSSIQDIDPDDKADTQHIQEAIKALPELTQRKNIIDMHMSVLTSLIKELDSKSLDSYFEIEQNMNDPKTQRQFVELLRTPAKEDNSKDKLRTYIMMYLQCDLPASFSAECETILQQLGVDMRPLEYIKKVKELNKMSAISTARASEKSTGDSQAYGNGSALFSGVASKLVGLSTEGSSKISEGLGSLITGIKKLLPEKTNLPITNIVESIMTPARATQASNDLTDDYLYFDPSAIRGSHTKQPKRSSYNEAMVFVVGGGNYLEYSNLQDWCHNVNASMGASGSAQKIVTYGSTRICSVNEFMDECTTLDQ